MKLTEQELQDHEFMEKIYQSDWYKSKQNICNFKRAKFNLISIIANKLRLYEMLDWLSEKLNKVSS